MLTVKQTVRKYLCSLKYFCTPLGTMFLGIIIGLSIMLPGILSSAYELFEEIKDLLGNINIDFNTLVDDLRKSVEVLNWNDPAGALNTVISPEWLSDNLMRSLNTMLGTDLDPFRAQISVLVENFIASAAVDLIWFCGCFVTGYTVGCFIIKLQISRDLAERSVLGWILGAFFSSTLTSVLCVAMTASLVLWRLRAIVPIIAVMLLIACLALVKSCIVHCYKKIPLKSIVNAKCICIFALASLLVFTIVVSLIVVLLMISSPVGLFVGLTVFEIIVSVIGVNTEDYVKTIAQKI